MERTESPTPEKLQSLREEGKVPYSPLATACGASLGAILSLLSVSKSFTEVLKILRESLSQNLSLLATFELLRSPVVSLLVLPALGALIGAFLVGLVQTRFLFKLDRISFDLARLGRDSEEGMSGFLSLLAAVPLAFVTVVVGVVPAVVLFGEVLALLNNERSYLLISITKLGTSLLVSLSLIWAALAICSWLGARYRFMLRHRMSASEVYRNARD